MLVGDHNHRLAPGQVMPGGDIPGAPALLQEFLHHPQGNPETMGNLDASALVVVVGGEDSFAQIQRECSHAGELITLSNNGYIIY